MVGKNATIKATDIKRVCQREKYLHNWEKRHPTSLELRVVYAFVTSRR